MPTATAGKATLKWEQPLAQRAPSVIPGLEPTQWRKVNASLPSLEALSPFMESFTPLIAPIGRWGSAYAGLCEALGLPHIRASAIMRATTVPSNHLSKILVPAMTSLTANVPWDRVFDPSTVWVSKGLQALNFSSEVMELLVKTGKVHRVLPKWKSGIAQKATDYKMQEADELGDFLNREVAGGGGGALGMGAPSAAAKPPTTILGTKLNLLGSKLTPEVESYQAILEFPKEAKTGPAPGELDVASPLSTTSPLAKRPSSAIGAAYARAQKQGQQGKQASADAASSAAGGAGEGIVAFAGNLKELKALLTDPKRNPFLSADPPRFVVDRKAAAAAVVGAKRTIVADVKKALVQAAAGAAGAKVEGAGQLFGALKAAGKQATAVGGKTA